MYNISDLKSATEILSLFDYTMNDDSRCELRTLLASPLDSVDSILARQAIIKGFIDNLEAIREYSCSRIDFHEVQRSLQDKGLQKELKGLRWKLFFSKRYRLVIRSKIIQLMILMDRLYHHYMQRIDISLFPSHYKFDLQLMNDFLQGFKTEYYCRHLQENNFSNVHIRDLIKVIVEKQESGQVTRFFNALCRFEVYVSIAKGIDCHGFSFPTFTDSRMCFEQIFHPLLKTPVKNDIEYHHNVVLLTGPNMSGKSTFLKSVGLSVYLAHLGLAVPATRAVLPFFDTIVVSINHNDDLISGYSHFMSEVMRLKEVVLECENGKRCFAIFDELFKGTNIEDALQISSTTINGLTKFWESYFLLSTHLHQLKTINSVRAGTVDTYYVDCQIREGLPVFNYQIRKGWSEVKVGQLLFKKEGLY